MTPAERAVVEAAVALAEMQRLLREGESVCGEAMSDALEANYRAVKALQKERE